MKKLWLFPLILALALGACAPDPAPDPAPGETTAAARQMTLPEEAAAPRETELPPSTGQIYLYGEAHGVKGILDMELELWRGCYRDQGLRHLFIESPYYTAQLLNLWMQADNDDLLDAVYAGWKGTMSHNPETKAFYQAIKSDCPETVFHGTDVGHQYGSTAVRYIKLLIDGGRQDSEEYRLALEARDQGMQYYGHHNHEYGDYDHEYRENTMAENFIRAFDKLEGESVMGIYGAAHTGLDAMSAYDDSLPCMANQLKARYGEAIHSVDLNAAYRAALPPLRIDTLSVDGKDYAAAYFGGQDMSGWSDYAIYREFWRLEDAYTDFKDRGKTSDVLFYNNYPMGVEEGQVFVIDYTKKDGAVVRQYFRSDGRFFGSNPVTEEFSLTASAVPLRIDTLTVEGKDYAAAYFGGVDISGWSDSYTYREFWRLEDAYGDFKDKPKNGDTLPDNGYPMAVAEGQVFVIDYTKKDGAVVREYFRSDGLILENMPSTEGFGLD